MPKRRLANEVTFVSPGQQLSIRLMDNTTHAICDAAINLKARYFVAVDGLSSVTDKPQWGVFDMSKAQKNNPTPGQWSINDPVKMFEFNQHDAAVMYAVHMLGRG